MFGRQSKTNMKIILKIKRRMARGCHIAIGPCHDMTQATPLTQDAAATTIFR